MDLLLIPCLLTNHSRAFFFFFPQTFALNWSRMVYRTPTKSFLFNALVSVAGGTSCSLTIRRRFGGSMNLGGSGVMVGVVAAVVDAKWTGTGLKTQGRSLEQPDHSTNQGDETNWRNKPIKKRKDLLDFDFGTSVWVLVHHCKVSFPTQHINLRTHSALQHMPLQLQHNVSARVCVCVGWCYQALGV